MVYAPLNFMHGRLCNSLIRADFISVLPNDIEQLAIKRYAIYSRSSVEKDSRNPFDSASAQFMVCAEFIGFQRQ